MAERHKLSDPHAVRRIFLAMVLVIAATMILLSSRAYFTSLLVREGWLPGPPSADRAIIPIHFRGVWLEEGSECGDRDSQLTILGGSIQYDTLSFIARRATPRSPAAVMIDGQSYRDGDPIGEQVILSLEDGGRKLYIHAPDLTPERPFVRC